MIRHVRPVPARDATGIVAAVYEEVRREFGALVEPFTLHSPAPALLAGVWRACRATLVTGAVRRPVKEAVAVGVSRANRCPYCVDAHTVMLDGVAAHDAARAIAAGRDDAIGDPGVRAAVAWAAATRTPHSALLATPPFTPHEAPEMLGTALVFHYINRPVTVLLGDSPLPSAGPWKGPLRRLAGWWFGRAMARPKPDDPAPLLPAAALPDDLRWAASSPPVADALARFVAAVEEEGARVLPAQTRLAIATCLEAWRGEDVGLGRHWLAPALAPLEESLRPAARLALLTALAPHQIDDPVVGAFRSRTPTDAALVAVLAWASLATARRIVRWLAWPDA
ncbi:MAG: carboxymuconolactone decarboxylase family protein [Deltaproteobacteria bacterium]|nr:carboxymuconolactone decarboxylase family protein [Deltaproteobacteria bacterium]